MLFSSPQIPDFAWLPCYRPMLLTVRLDKTLGLCSKHINPTKQKERKQVNKRKAQVICHLFQKKKNTKNSRPLSLHTQFQRTERERSESHYQTCHVPREPLREFGAVPATPAGDTQTTRLRGKQRRFVQKRGALTTQLHNAPQNRGRERADSPFLLLPQPIAWDKFS